MTISYSQELIKYSNDNVAILMNGVFPSDDQANTYFSLRTDYFINGNGNRSERFKLDILNHEWYTIDSTSYIANGTEDLISIVASNGYKKNGKIYFSQCYTVANEDSLNIFRLYSIDMYSKSLTIEFQDSFEMDFLYSDIINVIGSDSSDFLIIPCYFYSFYHEEDIVRKSYFFNTLSGTCINSKRSIRDIDFPVDSMVIQPREDKIFRYYPQSNRLEAYLNKKIYDFLPIQGFTNITDQNIYMSGRPSLSAIWYNRYNLVSDSFTEKRYFPSIENTCIWPPFGFTDMRSIGGKQIIGYTVRDSLLCGTTEPGSVNSPPNEYGIYIMDQNLAICDTVSFFPDFYYISTVQNNLNDSIVTLSGQIYRKPINGNSIIAGFVRIINLAQYCKEASAKSIDMAKVHIWPNPTSGEININYSGQTIDRVEVTDIRGNQVQLGHYVHNLSKVNLRGLTPGVYILHIQCNGSSFHKKVILN